MKLKFKIFFSILSFLVAIPNFAQELTDKEIGFDSSRITTRLKERGLTDDQIKQEILREREMEVEMFKRQEEEHAKLVKKIDDEIAQKKAENPNFVRPATPALQRQALIDLFISTGGTIVGPQGWTNKTGWDINLGSVVTSWNPATQTGWYGVNLDVNGNVKSLILNSNKLNGHIISLNEFPFLESLNLGYNSLLAGNLQSISSLTTLRTLNIDKTLITGSLNSLVSLVNLENLSFYSAQVSGSLDPLGFLINLSTLSFSRNQLTSNSLPLNFSNLTLMKQLDMFNTGFSNPEDLVSISTFFPLLENLTIATIYPGLDPVCYGGILPAQFASLTNLKVINIQNTFCSNSLTDVSSITNNVGLKLVFFINQIDLNISDSLMFQNLINLTSFNLINTNLNVFPILNAPSLIKFSIQNNNVQGQIPAYINTLTNLNYFHLQENKFRFNDIENNFLQYKSPGKNFAYANQKQTDNIETLSVQTGGTIILKMSDDELVPGQLRYTPNDTFWWFKNGFPLTQTASVNNRVLTISNANSVEHAGVYICYSLHPNNPNMPNWILERNPITLIVTSPLCTAPTDLQVAYSTNGVATISWNQLGTLATSWQITAVSNALPPVTTVFNSTQPNFALAGLASGFKYNVTVRGKCSNDLLSEGVSINVNLNCTKTNPGTQDVKQLFINLLNHLFSLDPNSIGPIYTCEQLTALAPYISVANPAIYDFSVSTISTGEISFSFSPNQTNYPDFTLNYTLGNILSHGSLLDINLDNYTSPETIFYGESTFTNGILNANIKSINFCPSFCFEDATITINPSGVSNVLCAGSLINLGIDYANGGGSQATYSWSVINLNTGQATLLPSNNSGFSPLSSFAIPSQGTYEVISTITSYSSYPNCSRNVRFRFDANCDFTSCTANNPQTQTIENLFIDLLNHLFVQSQSAAIPDDYTCKELKVLAPYISVANPTIYNFYSNNSQVSFSFSPDQIDNPDFKMDYTFGNISSYGLLNDLNLSYYTSQETSFSSEANFTNGILISNIKKINFCPDKLYCDKHVVIVVDESASIADNDIEYEAGKIREHLKRFILKQVDDNYNLGTNMHITLMGLSDNDGAYDRTGDMIKGIDKITSGNSSDYLRWIDLYRKRYKKNLYGVSPSSDYWKSGLAFAQSYKPALRPTNPDMVVLITDGCQTSDLDGSDLKHVMKNFSNYNPAVVATNPRLFVIGVENGYYVDENTSSRPLLRTNSDPNYENVEDELITTSDNKELTDSLDTDKNKTSDKETIANKNTFTGENNSNSQTANRTSLFLGKSLKFLFELSNLPEPQTEVKRLPENVYKKSVNFYKYDYVATDNFEILSNVFDKNFISNGLVEDASLSGEVDPTNKAISCGEKVKKRICDECEGFQPIPEKDYILSAWVKEEQAAQVLNFNAPIIRLIFKADITNTTGSKIDCISKGDIIDGWQRVFKKFTIPVGAKVLEIELINESVTNPVYFDDIRIHPADGSMKSFVYNPETFKLMSEMDENNYATFYEYDNEGGLIRVKKETEKGVKTIKETRSGNVINKN